MNMKDPLIRYVLIVLVLFLGTAVTPLFASGPKTMYVSLDPAPIKKTASSFSEETGTVDYAAKVRVLEEKKNWSRIELVDDPSVSGWVPSTALSSKKLKAKGTGTTADADEIALAGKGFTATIEAVYADEYEIDYTSVDYVESLAASPEDILSFINEGRLEGGAE